MWLLNAYRPCAVPFVTAMAMPKSAIQNGVAKNQLLPLAVMRLKTGFLPNTSCHSPTTEK
jgi:hypothetical protein